MKLNIMDLITIEDNKYIVADRIKHNNIDYYLIVNENDKLDFAIGFIENEDFVLVDDPEDYIELTKLLAESSIINNIDIKEVLNLEETN